jgi:hypothetical protein
MYDSGPDSTQYDPGDYVRSAVPDPIMGTKKRNMPGGGAGSGYVKTGAPVTQPVKPQRTMPTGDFTPGFQNYGSAFQKFDPAQLKFSMNIGR